MLTKRLPTAVAQQCAASTSAPLLCIVSFQQASSRPRSLVVRWVGQQQQQQQQQQLRAFLTFVMNDNKA
jgi:hypothetical protein